jgi:uncharacterized protein YecE (DUF72 family)
MEIRIGTSGWHYDHWRGPFYPDRLPPRRMLAHYATVFDTVEINNTFYRLPTPNALRNWYDGTPAGFLFAVKASRYLTHIKRLTDTTGGLENYFSRVDALGEKLGPILFLMPPRWSFNPERLETFLAALSRRHRYAFEFRDPDWHRDELYALLRRHNVAFCLYDLAGVEAPHVLTADFVYVRLHGPGAAYAGSYSETALADWAARLRDWSRERRARAAYVYFDNDQEAYAVANARTLKQILVGERTTPSAASR